MGSREVTEALFVFLFSVGALSLYLAQDGANRRREKQLEQQYKESGRLARELSASYLYIGEVNRRFEILKDITLEIPALIEDGKNGARSYHDILRAIRTFSECKDFCVVIFSPERTVVFSEFYLPGSNCPGIPAEITVQDICATRRDTFENKLSFVLATGNIDGVSCLGIFRHTPFRADVLDLIKPLLLQILFLYAYSHRHILSKESV